MSGSESSKQIGSSRIKVALIATSAIPLLLLVAIYVFVGLPTSVNLGLDRSLQTAWNSSSSGSTTQFSVVVPKGDAVVILCPYSDESLIRRALPSANAGAVSAIKWHVPDESQGPVVLVLNKSRVIGIDDFTYSGGFDGGVIAWPVTNGSITVGVQGTGTNNLESLRFLSVGGCKVSY